VSQGEALIGKVLHDTHRVVRMIGQGGMGAVYEAEHVRLPSKRFAIKVLLAQVLDAPNIHKRFWREAKIASDIGHPNIIEVVDYYDTDDGCPCMVMELLTGCDLQAVLAERGALTPKEARPILAQVCSALQATHDAGVVHRDLKPANIFLTSDGSESVMVKLLDFGISKIRDARTKLTDDRAILGTPHYMSPEQSEGLANQVDHKTDIFSLGTIVYEMLTGQLPFEAATPLAILLKICRAEPAPPSAVKPELGPEIDAIIAKAMAKDPDERFDSVTKMLQALDQALAKLPERGEHRVALAKTIYRTSPASVAPREQHETDTVDPQGENTPRRDSLSSRDNASSRDKASLRDRVSSPEHQEEPPVLLVSKKSTQVARPAKGAALDPIESLADASELALAPPETGRSRIAAPILGLYALAGAVLLGGIGLFVWRYHSAGKNDSPQTPAKTAPKKAGRSHTAPKPAPKLRTAKGRQNTTGATQRAAPKRLVKKRRAQKLPTKKLPTKKPAVVIIRPKKKQPETKTTNKVPETKGPKSKVPKPTDDVKTDVMRM
jgi:serine/threonine protein kinase